MLLQICKKVHPVRRRNVRDKYSAFDAMELSVLKKNARAFYAERLRPEDNYQKLIRIYEDISK